MNTCRCGHPHLPGQAWCYACERPVPINVPPAVEPTPPAPAGGAQPLHGQAWRDAMRKATADLHKAQRNQRGKRPGKPITGYIKPPDGER